LFLDINMHIDLFEELPSQCQMVRTSCGRSEHEVTCVFIIKLSQSTSGRNVGELIISNTTRHEATNLLLLLIWLEVLIL